MNNKPNTQKKEAAPFTGGEWSVFKTAANDVFVIANNKGTICKMLDTVKEAEANARLLVESKNMYFALKDLIDLCGCFHATNEKIDNAQTLINRIEKQQ